MYNQIWSYRLFFQTNLLKRLEMEKITAQNDLKLFTHEQESDEIWEWEGRWGISLLYQSEQKRDNLGGPLGID